MFMHYWDPHTPYLPPRAYRRLFYEGDPYDPTNTSLDAMREHPLGQAWEEAWFKMLGGRVTDADYIEALYDGEIRFLDEGLAMLIGALEKQGLADDTLVVITGDHGELMYRHGVFFDHHGLYDGNLHVPLIVHHPSLAPRRVPQLVASIDVAPTILDFCQLETPPEMDGTALTPWLRGEREDAVRPYVVSQECTWQMKWSLRRPDEKVIVAREPDYYGTPPLEYYDLREDPDEMNNRADDRPERAAELAQELEAWLAARMAAHGLEEDPLVAHGLTLGRAWKEGRTADLPGPIPE
jgi:arylsulfatase A-like enzyme